MGVEKTNTTDTSFIKKVGNWWNKNGNAVGNGLQVAGTTAMGAGMTGMFIDAMNHSNRSIFGNCYSPYSMMSCGFGGCCSQYSMMNPMMMNPMMGMSGSIFGCC